MSNQFEPDLWADVSQSFLKRSPCAERLRYARRSPDATEWLEFLATDVYSASTCSDHSFEMSVFTTQEDLAL